MNYRTGFTRKELLVVVAILSVLVAIFFLGESPPSVIPLAPPNENNRYYCHENDIHFSIICPEKWNTSTAINIRSMSATDVTSSSYPLGTMIAMGTPFYPHKEKDEIERLPTMEFQGGTAYYEKDAMPPRKMLGPSGYFFALYFERDGNFYRLSYFVNRKMKEFPPPIIFEYFNTFKVENEKMIGKSMPLL